MSRAWMPLYVADYLADTRHLGALEHGAYLLLIMHYWQTGGLPDDDRQLARIAATSPDEWATVRETVGNFFEPGWKHPRIDDELARAADISDKRRGAAASRWGPPDMHLHDNSNPTALQGQSKRIPPPDPPLQSQSQSPSPSEERTDFDNGKKSERDRAGPAHGARSKTRGTIYLQKGTSDWESYAEDYRSAHNGKEPVTDRHGGHWFKYEGELGWRRRA